MFPASPAALIAFEIKLRKRAVFQQCDPHLERGGIDYDFAFHLKRTQPDGHPRDPRRALDTHVI